MKHLPIVSLVSVMITISCSPQINIREAAIVSERHTTLNSCIEFYSRCYHKLPTTLQDISKFLDEWEMEDPESCYPPDHLDEMLNYIESTGLLIESHTDSLFIFDKKNNIGCCVYGTPEYWIQNPQNYPSEKMDYWDIFRTSAFDMTGRYIFRANYSEIDSAIVKIGKKFPWRQEASINVQHWPDGKLVQQSVPFKAILQYDRITDSLSVLATMPTNVMAIVPNEEYAPHEFPANKPILDSKPNEDNYLSDLRKILHSFADNYRSISKIIFCCSIYCGQ